MQIISRNIKLKYDISTEAYYKAVFWNQLLRPTREQTDLQKRKTVGTEKSFNDMRPTHTTDVNLPAYEHLCLLNSTLLAFC